MKITKIDNGRWNIGAYRVEWAWKLRPSRWEIGGYKERENWDDELGRFVALMFVRLWWHRPSRSTDKWPKSHRRGWTLDARCWQRWWGNPDGDGEDRVYFRWRDAVLDWVFGKTVCIHESAWESIVRKPHQIRIPLPEGEYEAEAVFEHRVWLRPRWPFHRYRTYTDVRVKEGLPFEGKGENSWDCGEDATMGYSVQGHDLEKAVAEGVRITLRNRERYGTPSRIKLMVDAQKAASQSP